MKIDVYQVVFVVLALALGLLFGLASSSYIVPILASGIVSALVILGSKFLKDTSLKSLNVIVLGLFLGYLITHLLFSMIRTIDSVGIFEISKNYLLLTKMSIYLVCSYLGMVFMWKAQDNWTLSIPFVRLIPSQDRKKDFLLDSAVLTDPRLIDLAATGLFDQRLILPRFVLFECRKGLDQEGDIEKQRAAA